MKERKPLVRAKIWEYGLLETDDGHKYGDMENDIVGVIMEMKLVDFQEFHSHGAVVLATEVLEK